MLKTRGGSGGSADAYFQFTLDEMIDRALEAVRDPDVLSVKFECVMIKESDLIPTPLSGFLVRKILKTSPLYDHRSSGGGVCGVPSKEYTAALEEVMCEGNYSDFHATNNFIFKCRIGDVSLDYVIRDVNTPEKLRGILESSGNCFNILIVDRDRYILRV